MLMKVILLLIGRDRIESNPSQKRDLTPSKLLPQNSSKELECHQVKVLSYLSYFVYIIIEAVNFLLDQLGKLMKQNYIKFFSFIPKGKIGQSQNNNTFEGRTNTHLYWQLATIECGRCSPIYVDIKLGFHIGEHTLGLALSLKTSK